MQLRGSDESSLPCNAARQKIFMVVIFNVIFLVYLFICMFFVFHVMFFHMWSYLLLSGILCRAAHMWMGHVTNMMSHVTHIWLRHVTRNSVAYSPTRSLALFHQRTFTPGRIDSHLFQLPLIQIGLFSYSSVSFEVSFHIYRPLAKHPTHHTFPSSRIDQQTLWIGNYIDLLSYRSPLRCLFIYMGLSQHIPHTTLAHQVGSTHELFELLLVFTEISFHIFMSPLRSFFIHIGRLRHILHTTRAHPVGPTHKLFELQLVYIDISFHIYRSPLRSLFKYIGLFWHISHRIRAHPVGSTHKLFEQHLIYIEISFHIYRSLLRSLFTYI